MNYYYPYFSMPYTFSQPLAQTAARGGLGRLLGGIKWSSILNGTQKTLGIVNQTIPLVKQAKPILNNARTMFRVMNEFKKVDTPVKTTTQNITNSVSDTSNIVPEKTLESTTGPTFFA